MNKNELDELIDELKEIKVRRFAPEEKYSTRCLVDDILDALIHYFMS